MIEPGWGFAVNTFCRSGDRAEIEEMLRLGPAAEAAGLDSVWVGDHVLWHTPIVDAMAVLSAFAATTSRVTLGTAIYLLGLRQPAVAAKAITAVNVMSGGRLVLGVGVGGEHPPEFEAAGVPFEDRGRLLDEGLRFLAGQWEDDADVPRLAPSGPRVPVLVGGRSSPARRRIRRFDAGWLAAFVSPRRIREEVELLGAERGSPVPVALNVYLRTGADHERTRSEAAAFLAHTYAMEPEPLMRYSVAGTPEACAEELAGYAEAGVRHFVLRPADWDQTGQLDAWADKLLPRLASVDLPGREGAPT